MDSSSFTDVTNISLLSITVCGSVVGLGVCVLVVVCYKCWQSKRNQARETRRETQLMNHHRNDHTRDSNVVAAPGEGTSQQTELQLENAELQPNLAPPSYNRASQYRSVDLEHTEVVAREEDGYYVSLHIAGDDELTPQSQDSNTNINIGQSRDASESEVSQDLQVASPSPLPPPPPTYSTTQLELMALAGTPTETEQIAGCYLTRDSPSESRINMSAEGNGPLPPTYSTAQLELMDRRADTEHVLHSTTHFEV